MAPTRSSLPGLRTLGALAVAAALGAGAALVWFVHAPWLRERMREDTDRLVREALVEVQASRREDIDRAGAVVRAGADHLVERWGRDLHDLPFELCAGDPAACRRLVGRSVEEAGTAARENARVLADEVRRRSEARVEALEGSLRELQARTGSATAASLAVSSSFLLVGILAGLLVVQALLLGRAVVRPVRRIAEGADRLASGDLGARVEEGGSREVADLAAGLNRMAAAVETANAEVRAINADLERRVEEKSRALVRAETLASLGTLAGGVAHEFNNVLGGILGTAEEALQDARDPEVRESLDLVARTARRGCAVTENLLRFARPRPPRSEPVDAAAVVRDAAGLFHSEAERRGVALEVRAGPVPPFPADPAEVHQVVLNLLSNALAFTPRGGRVLVEAAADGDDAVVRVSDSGPGIPPDAMPRLFEPFFTTRGSEGTGLGLAVSHGIARAHGGSLAAANAPGGGAVFTLRLPRSGGKGGRP